MQILIPTGLTAAPEPTFAFLSKPIQKQFRDVQVSFLFLIEQNVTATQPDGGGYFVSRWILGPAKTVHKVSTLWADVNAVGTATPFSMGFT